MKRIFLLFLLTGVGYSQCIVPTSTTSDLIVAIEQGKLKKVQESITEADINARYTIERNTPLIEAVIVFIKDRVTCRRVSKTQIALLIGGLGITTFLVDKCLQVNDLKKRKNAIPTNVLMLYAPDTAILSGLLTGGLAAHIIYTLCKPSDKRLKERFAIIELLVNYGADIHATNAQEKTVQTIIEQCLVEHADDQYLVGAMKALNEILKAKMKTIATIDDVQIVATEEAA